MGGMLNDFIMYVKDEEFKPTYKQLVSILNILDRNRFIHLPSKADAFIVEKLGHDVESLDYWDLDLPIDEQGMIVKTMEFDEFMAGSSPRLLDKYMRLWDLNDRDAPRRFREILEQYGYTYQTVLDFQAYKDLFTRHFTYYTPPWRFYLYYAKMILYSEPIYYEFAPDMKLDGRFAIMKTEWECPLSEPIKKYGEFLRTEYTSLLTELKEITGRMIFLDCIGYWN